MRRLRLGLAVAAALVFVLAPVAWMVLTSLQGGSALFTVTYWPSDPAWDNYVAVFREQPLGRTLLNSLVVACVTVAGSLTLAVFAAAALARVSFRGRALLLYVLLGVSMFPHVAVLAGLFELLTALGLYNHPLGLSLSYTLFILPFTIWVLTSFLSELPREIEEAAIADGAGPVTIVRRIFLPLLGPALVTTGLLAFVVAWNEFLFALTFTLTTEARTVPVSIALITGASQHELPWGRIMAASVVVTAPVVALAVVFQRRIVAGLTAGAVRG
jgi:trehalose/maltose transport system permease protein